MDSKVKGKVNRPLSYMDHNNNFNNQQVEKINSMIKNQYNRFTDRTFQEQETEAKVGEAINAKSNLVSNLSAVEYNNVGYAQFQFLMFILTIGEYVKIFETNHEIDGDILFNGSVSNTLYTTINQYGNFKGEGNAIYFKLTADPPQLLAPWVNLTWRYK